MTTAAYMRKSADDQSFKSQKIVIDKWLKGQGIPPAKIAWYTDSITGKTTDRPELDRLQADIFQGSIKTVVVYKLDRLSRKLHDGINLLADWCDRGLRVVSVTQQIDLSGAVGRMVAAVLFGVAEIELELRKERQTAGIEVAKKNGVYKGRKPGTRKADARRAAELLHQGLTVPEIASALDVSTRTVLRYLQFRSTTQTAVV